MVLLLIKNNFKVVLNAQFKSVFTVESNEPLPDKGPSPHPTMPDFSIISGHGIKSLLHNLNVHKLRPLALMKSV